MEFESEGIILHARAHGETHAVVNLLTAEKGRWAGLVYGGQGRRQQPVLQPGNGVLAKWRGRSLDDLGHFSLDLTNARAGAAMQDRLALAGLSALCAVSLSCLPEREPHRAVYDGLLVVLDALETPEIWPALMAKWELGLLAALGFGLSLDRCVATGVRDNLIYVSPKSAHAVSADAGAPYHAQMLPLPAFLRGDSVEATREEAREALRTTGYFLETRVLHPAGVELPAVRRDLGDRLGNAPVG